MKLIGVISWPDSVLNWDDIISAVSECEFLTNPPGSLDQPAGY